MTNGSIAQARLRNSRLAGPGLATPAEVVGWFGAVQAQDVPGSLWGIAQRLVPAAHATLVSLGAAMDDGRIARTHALRPTWHFLVPAELRWIQALTGHRVHQVNAAMYRAMGLGPEELGRAEAAIQVALGGGRALTRDELAATVAPLGIDVADPLAITHIAMHAELEALIVNGPRRGKQATYGLVDERIVEVPALDPPAALRELTVRYFQSHGPALAHDMAWWSGLTVSAVREGIELAGPALEGRRIDGMAYWAAADAFDPLPGLVPDAHVLLLPNYDEYLGSYADYGPVFDAALPRARTTSDVLGTNLIVRDGLVVGGWRRMLARDRVTVTVTLLLPFTPAELDALAEAAEAFGRFVELAVDLRVGPR